MTRSDYIWELARELHRQRGMDSWHRVSKATRARWYTRAEETLLRGCPQILRAIDAAIDHDAQEA